MFGNGNSRLPYDDPAIFAAYRPTDLAVALHHKNQEAHIREG